MGIGILPMMGIGAGLGLLRSGNVGGASLKELNMGIGILPMMGIGAGLGLLRSGNVGGALQGAALGGVGGAIGNMLKAGEALKGAELVSGAAKGTIPAGAVGGSNVLAGATGASSVPGSTAFWQGANTAGLGNGLNVANATNIPGAAAFEASMGLPSSSFMAAGGDAATALGGRASQMGLVQGASGNLVNPEYFLGAGTPLETFKGGQGLFANATGNLLDTLPDYVTPKNLLGAGTILASMQPRQQTQITPSPTGGMRQGGAVQSVNFGMAQPIPRRRGMM